MNRIATDSTPRPLAPSLPRLRVPRVRIDGWLVGLVALALTAPLVVAVALHVLALVSGTRPADLRDVERSPHEASEEAEPWPGAPCCWDVR
jgi:hypothetical protein